MRPQQIHTNVEIWFSLKGDYTERGACYAIE